MLLILKRPEQITLTVLIPNVWAGTKGRAPRKKEIPLAVIGAAMDFSAFPQVAVM